MPFSSCLYRFLPYYVFLIASNRVLTYLAVVPMYFLARFWPIFRGFSSILTPFSGFSGFLTYFYSFFGFFMVFDAFWPIFPRFRVFWRIFTPFSGFSWFLTHFDLFSGFFMVFDPFWPIFPDFRGFWPLWTHFWGFLGFWTHFIHLVLFSGVLDPGTPGSPQGSAKISTGWKSGNFREGVLITLPFGTDTLLVLAFFWFSEPSFFRFFSIFSGFSGSKNSYFRLLTKNFLKNLKIFEKIGQKSDTVFSSFQKSIFLQNFAQYSLILNFAIFSVPRQCNFFFSKLQNFAKNGHFRPPGKNRKKVPFQFILWVKTQKNRLFPGPRKPGFFSGRKIGVF